MGNIGVYQGTANVDGVRDWGSWLGRTAIYATDYLNVNNVRNGWTPIAANDWGAWKRGAQGRRVVWGLTLTTPGTKLADTASGGLDKMFKDTAAVLVSAGLGDSIIRLGYEPNNPEIGTWEGTHDPVTYRAAFRRAVNALRSVKGANFKIDLTFAVGSAGNVGKFLDLYPGAQYVDYVGIDVYDVWWGNPNATASQRWQHTWDQKMGLSDFINFRNTVRKPPTFPEWGLYKPGDQYAGGGDNPYFVDRMADLIIATGAVYHSYFNQSWGGGTISDFPAGMTRYQSRFGV